MKVMRQAQKILSKESHELVCGLFSKREAAALIVQGSSHVHSSTLGDRDPLARLTRDGVKTGSLVRYPWELTGQAEEVAILSSRDRYDSIRNILGKAVHTAKRNLKEKLESVLEELISNAIYHAYRNSKGGAKYERRDSINLKESEKVIVRFGPSLEGFYISVQDQGGSLPFLAITESFERCYGNSANQIDAKESGAGLGLYMAFETATHMKVVSLPGKKTEIICWIADKHTYDPDVFSFNYFAGR